jgi:hypothetical protein
MSYSKINYKDSPDTSTPINAFNLNKMDSAIYDNDVIVTNLVDGWIKPTETFTYRNAFSMNTSADMTGKLSIGDKIKITQSNVVKQFYITGITATYILVNTTTDWSVFNQTISNVYYSHEASPLGFPQWFSYLPSFSNITLGENASVVAKYNMVGRQVNVSMIWTLVASSAINAASNIKSFSLPIATVAGQVQGKATFLDSGSTYYQGIVVGGGSTVEIYALLANGTYSAVTNITSTVPFTWTTNDNININVSYRI